MSLLGSMTPVWSQSYGYGGSPNGDGITSMTRGSLVSTQTYTAGITPAPFGLLIPFLTQRSLGSASDTSSSDNGGSVQGTANYTYGSQLYGYNNWGVDARTNTITDARGNTTTIVLDYGGSLESPLKGYKVTAPSYAGGGTNTQTLSTTPNFLAATQATTTDQLGHVWTTNMDSWGRMTSSVDPLTNTWQVQYNVSNPEITQITDPTLITWRFNYGEAGAPASRLTSVTDPGNVVRAVFTYDPIYGQLVSSKVPAAVSASGQDEITQFAYDAVKGDLTGVTSPLGNKATVNAYDALGDPLSVSVYPDTGNPQTSLTPLTTTFNYDAAQMPKLITSAAGTSLQTTFDNGMISVFQIVKQGTTLAQMNLSRDTRGRIYEVTDLKGTMGKFRFDKNSNLTKILDGNGNVTITTYGPVSEPTGGTWPDNKSTSVLYDTAGRIRQATDERGIVSTFGYDNANRLKDVQFPAYATQNIHLNYDEASRLTSISDISGSITYNYEATRKRLTGVTTVLSALPSGSNSFPVAYGYYADGKCSWMSIVIKGQTYTTTYSYDRAGHLISMTNPFGDVTSWTRDRAGRLTNETTLPSGGVPIATTYGYGVSGMAGDPSTAPAYLRAITETTGGTAFWNYTLKHSALGQLLEQGATGANSTVETETFTYDTRGRLATEGQIYTVGGTSSFQTGDYQYDLANNLQGVPGRWSYNSNNQVMTAAAGNGLTGMTGLAYDFAGNLTAANGLTLAYDPFGRLSSVTGTGLSATYRYNALGQRVSKTVGGTTTYFLYNGGLLLAELDGTGKMTRFYTWGAAGLVSDYAPFTFVIDSNQAGSNGLGGAVSGASQYYLYDGRGNTRATVDRNGSLLSRGAYGAWGAAYGNRVPTTPLGWQGRHGGYTDTETELVLLGHRYYAPNLGRFVRRDPIGVAGGLNVYAYACDDPINLCDPSGLDGENDEVSESDDYILNHVDDYSVWGHLRATTYDAVKNAVWPPTIGRRLRRGAEGLGNTAGRYDAGKASAGQVALSAAALGVDVVGTAFATYGTAKMGINGVGAMLEGEAAEAGAAGGGCFVAGTLAKEGRVDAKSKDGYRVVDTKIEQVKQGDSVVSRDERTGKTALKRVLHTTKRTVPVVVEVTLADKSGKVIETITATRNHPFSVRGKGFVAAGGLAIGNAIVTRAGPDVVVAKVEWKRRAEGFAVYNFEVEDHHTYFVGNSGAWVHNPAQECTDVAINLLKNSEHGGSVIRVEGPSYIPEGPAEGGLWNYHDVFLDHQGMVTDPMRSALGRVGERVPFDEWVGSFRDPDSLLKFRYIDQYNGKPIR